MLNQNLIQELHSRLKKEQGAEVSIKEIQPVSGGSINSTFSVKTNRGAYFLKFSSKSLCPNMFEKEVEGISTLSAELNTPYIIGVGEVKDEAYLLMQLIHTEMPQSGSFEKAGKQLANLHKHTSSWFGLQYNNYIGTLEQSNLHHKDWTSFFINERLTPLVKKATDQGKLTNNVTKHFENLYKELPNIFPMSKASLLHGDLWSGNLIFDDKGEPYFIDPAIYYGHREMDIAMTQLFGRFNNTFYDSYQELFPLENNWQERTDICNLYPLLVHVNLFGGSYANDVWHIVKAF